MTSDTSVPQYIPFPRFLLDMKLSHTAKLIYSVLLYRANLSKINGWIDEQGRVYITYPVTEIAENLHKGVSVIKEGLSALDRAGLTERKRNFSAPDTIYVKLPTEGLKTDPQTAGKPAACALFVKRSRRARVRRREKFRSFFTATCAWGKNPLRREVAEF